MSETRSCSHCMGAVPADSPLGLCPQCLLIMGMDTLSVTPGAGDDGDLKIEEQSTHGPHSLPPLPTRLGDYQIQRLLGKGGMGVVYEAEHVETGRRMALKLLAQGFDSSQRRTRFIREGRLAAAVNHPHSVYVYGTEEINGVPAIAMELVDGGTLRDRVKESGPLPIGEAADAILQVISGLEAAQEVGVLHRDVKPANCFVDLEGKTKIGDFGLSISNETQAIPDLSSDGRMLGTPAYASPEQLRGEPLDVRSDIYSVGATLYYLLTGRHPFDADDLVEMLSLVFEQAAPNPKNFRDDIPDGICEAVLRCLHKQAGNRFHSYEELRQALLPFRSSAPTPATYGRRILAGYIDQFVIGAIPTAIVLGVLLGGSQPEDWTASFRFMVAGSIGVIGMLYFGLLEGTIGASIGKRVCGLRVVSEDRSEPSFLRILGRSSVYLFVPAVPAWTYGFFVPAAFGETPTNWWEHVIASSSLLVLGIVFCTARKSNGWAGLHEFLSHTRVVMKSEKARRPVIFVAEPTSSNVGERDCLGPFHILQTLRRENDEAWYLGFDSRLLRRVWLRATTKDKPTVAASVRDQKRATRLRWIGGRRQDHDSWDAFEAPKGQALLRIIESPQPWDAVRYWLIDLAEELIAAQQAGNVPTLSLDRIWITKDGRVKLLDFPVPSLSGTADVTRKNNGSGTVDPQKSIWEQVTSGRQETRAFLKEVAVSALSGRHISGEELNQHNGNLPLPLHARGSLLALSDSIDLKIWTEHLRETLDRPTNITQRQRTGMLGALVAPSLVLAMIQVIIFCYLDYRQTKSELERVAAAHMSSEPTTVTIRNHATVHRFVQMITVALVSVSSFLSVEALGAAFCSVLFRGGPILWLWNSTFVTENGKPASRLRLLMRNIVAWGPMWTFPIWFALMMPLLKHPSGGTLFMLLLGVIIAGCTQLALLPERGLADRIVGTRMVRR
ncbi:MAG: putative RDD family membrane protein YckC [Pirellulaceae bacterium]|jgi:uncharacterized RDD family membrane protein YckC/tRNA A-37 threonylcarbamoyl transferase component Bud32